MVIRCAVTNTSAASCEIPCSAESYMSKGCWTIWLPATALTFRVSTWSPRHSPRDRPPLHLRSTGSSSRELRVSLEYVANRIPRNPCEPRDPPLRFPSPSRHPRPESTNSGLPHPPDVPPSAFLTLSTGYSSGRFAGLFHPAATCGICFPGISPDAKPHRLSTAVPLMTLDDALLLLGRPEGRFHSSRSQRPVYRVLLLTPVRCHRQSGLGSADARFPLKFSPPRACLRLP